MVSQSLDGILGQIDAMKQQFVADFGERYVVCTIQVKTKSKKSELKESWQCLALECNFCKNCCAAAQTKPMHYNTDHVPNEWRNGQ